MTGSTLASPAPSPETGPLSIRFKHSFFECRMPSVLYCPTLSSTVSTAAASATVASITAASTTAAPAARNTWASNFSSIVRPLSSVVCRPSSIVQLFVPLRFAIFFYSKITIIEPTHGAPPAPHRRTMG